DQPLVHRVGREPRRERIGPHHFWRDRDADAVFGEPAQRIFGRQQAANAPVGIGERGRDSVPAVQDDVIARFAPRAAFAAATLNAARLRPRLPFALAHEAVLSWRRRSGNLSRKTIGRKRLPVTFTIAVLWPYQIGVAIGQSLGTNEEKRT